VIKLTELLENKLNEFREGFDLDSFLKMNSFAAQVRYAGKTLKRLGSGSSRIVFEIDDTKVLKLAKNLKGIAQNKVEGDWFVNDEYYNIIARVLERDDNYRWIVSERAKKITPTEFKRLCGVDINEFYAYVCYVTRKCHAWKYPSDETKRFLDESEFATEVCELLVNTDANAGDLSRISTYGRINDRLVIVDYGLSTGVYRDYYQ
jgi:hypothetical protein